MEYFNTFQSSTRNVNTSLHCRFQYGFTSGCLATVQGYLEGCEGPVSQDRPGALILGWDACCCRDKTDCLHGYPVFDHSDVLGEGKANQP